jgi:hypothetical protein
MRLAVRQPPLRRRLACRRATSSASDAGAVDDGLARAAALSGLPLARLAALPPALRSRLASDPARVAAAVLHLKAALPGADVAALVGRAPGLLDPDAAVAAAAAVPAARELLLMGGADGVGDGDSASASQNVDALIAAQPLLLTADLGEVVAEIQR